MDRHNSAEASKASDVPVSESSHTISNDARNNVVVVVAAEGENDIRQYLSSLFKETDFNLRKFLFINVPQAIVNFYNKVIVKVVCVIMCCLLCSCTEG